MFSSKNQFLTGAGSYQIQRSVRLRTSASAYFNRTFTTPTNNRIFTWSGWIKRGALGVRQGIFIATDAGTTSFFGIEFTAGNLLQIQDSNYSTGAAALITSQVFRDPSSWYHIVMAIDTTQTTASNRYKLYVNGSQITAFSSANYAAQNSTPRMNSAVSHDIGSWTPATPFYFDGYLTEINFIDGQALTPSSFGQVNAYGVWSPIKYTGTYGTNGFYLNFSDNSAATAAAIGKDYSGNGNNWTPNNISVTAGTTYDSMTDVPTLTSATAANYPVLNPLKIYTGTGSNLVLTDGNLTATNTQAQTGLSIATMRLPSTGKWYWEVNNVAGNGLLNYAGMVITEANADSNSATISGNYRSNGAITNIAGTAQTSGATYTAGDVIGVAVDVDAGTVQFYKNGTAQGATPSFTFTAGTILVPTVANDNSVGTKTFAANFGQRPFNSTPPTGFVALNTQNLPTPTISNGATVMAATLYTGNGSTQTISNAVNGVSFQPDFVWIKNRTAVLNHNLVNSVAGATRYLESNTTAVEVNNSGVVSAITSTGFSVGSAPSVNGSTNALAAWQWQAGAGSSSSNTSGSITSTVSVNATSGFSVVTYTGTGANATVGHGLGVAPKLIIVKNRSAIDNWWVYHTSIGATNYLSLNLTDASQANVIAWNNTSPTSSVFSIGTASRVNGSGNSMVAYCFAAVVGYSAFGSYTGNGSADGPFVYLGFRPRFIMYKRTDAVASWYILDSSRGTYNANTPTLYPNLSNAEGNFTSAQGPDFLSNGFKVHDTASDTNASGGTYIYAAFAENPFKYSLAR